MIKVLLGCFGIESGAEIIGAAADYFLDDKAKKVVDEFQSRVHEVIGKVPANHDLERALWLTSLTAARVVVDNFRRWIEADNPDTRGIVHPPVIDAAKEWLFDQVGVFRTPEGMADDEVIAELNAAVDKILPARLAGEIEAALAAARLEFWNKLVAGVAEKAGPPPADFKAVFFGEAGWNTLFLAFMREALKNNKRAEIAFITTRLAGSRESLRRVEDRLEGIARGVADIKDDTGAIRAGVGEVKGEVAVLKALVQQLLANRAGPAAPGQERAVGEAVAAAEAGAEAGDARLQKALELLGEQKVAEAQDIFKSVAAEKGARIQRDKKDAAAAYRNLGAIAGLRDEKAAYEAYAEALKYEPDDIECLFWAGYLQTSRGGTLAAAEANLLRARELADRSTGNQSWFRFWSRTCLGDVQVKRNDLGGALKSYEEGLEISRRRYAADPSHAERARDVFVSLAKMGMAAVAGGDGAGACERFNEAKSIIGPLAKKAGDNAVLQNDLRVIDAMLRQHCAGG